MSVDWLQADLRLKVKKQIDDLLERKEKYSTKSYIEELVKLIRVAEEHQCVSWHFHCSATTLTGAKQNITFMFQAFADALKVSTDAQYHGVSCVAY